MSEEATLDEFTETTAAQERQQTPIGELPTDWEMEWLKDVVEINPDGFSEDDWALETFEYISLSEASDGEIEDSKTTPIEDAPSRAQRTVQQEDILVGTVRPKQRSHGFVGEKHAEKVCSSGFGVLRSETRLNSRYLFQEILSNRFFSQMEAYVAGSGYPSVKISDLKKHRVAIPPLPEQRKIATVLHTVDQAIQKTEEIIEQTKRVKTGVSQHYFEDYNTIRREENPKSVEMVELSNLVDFKPGKAWKTDNLSEEGLKVVRISNLTGQKDEYWRYNSDYEERRVIENGDLLFSWAGMKSSIGVHIYRGEKALLNQHIYNLEPKTSIGRKYLYYYLDYRMSDLYSLSQGGAVQVHLTKDIIERILIPKVPAEKQESMVAHLSEIDNALQNEIARKNRLKRLKRGLMQDLLSGEVRTTDVDIDIPEEVAKYG